MPSSSAPPLETTREVRFAVVMYGGVSLAIYINGITQELFHMVRATAKNGARALLFGAAATDSSDNPLKLSPTERVYRKLSYLLSNQELLNRYRTYLSEKDGDNSAAAPDAPPQKKDVAEELEALITNNQDPINTRFIVDIMSGTSAGGINSIYLAKALANDQRIDQLKSLWLNEGDIALLINDQLSVADLQLSNQQRPQSLLNSRRMYLKLLASFNDMEGKEEPNEKLPSPYVDEMDLFITATDLEGEVVPIRLSDMMVQEKRYRHVFHFRYSVFENIRKAIKPSQPGAAATPPPAGPTSIRNDFHKFNNPFLAFAARCTSSFPFAFEPMLLCDIDEVVNVACPYKDDADFIANKQTWPGFFGAKARAQDSNIDKRAFGDGGYLDNKPFSYATETLSRRHAAVPVDRKLIYIEPSPEHPEKELQAKDVPNALQNVKKAVLDLPTYETIREDLERVIERNRLIQRVNGITAAIERDVDQLRLRRPSLNAGEWQRFDLADMVKRFGIYYLPYRRLRIAAASDELAKLVARVAGLDENSAHYFAIRILIRAWREVKYSDYHDDKAPADDIDVLAERILQRMAGERSEPAAAANLEEQKKAILSELRSWIQVNCADYHKQETPPKDDAKTQSSTVTRAQTANQFLIDYDYKYWLRRLTFIRQKLDDVYRLNWSFADKSVVTDNDFRDPQKAIVDRFQRLTEDKRFDYCTLTVAEKTALKDTIKVLKEELADIYGDLRSEGRKVQSLSIASDDSKAIAAAIKEIKIEPHLLDYLLALPKGAVEGDQQFARINEDLCVKRAKRLLVHANGQGDGTDYDENLAQSLNALELTDKIDAAANALKAEFQKSITDASNGTSTWSRCRLLLNANAACLYPKPPSDKADAIREYLWRYFSQFDDFDQVRFPILYGTEVGESDVVEIIRISPEDAPSLIAERSQNEKRRKLAGTTLFHFGAFLDRSWRQNDIMWGRLDGAERLITALLPDTEDPQGSPVDNSKIRSALIEEAHRAILDEEFPVAGRKEMGTRMTEALLEAGKDNDVVGAINQVVNNLKTASPTSRPLEDVLMSSLDEKGFLEFMKKGYEVNRKIDPEPTLRAVSRSTQVIGKIFQDIADQNGLDGKNLAWIARLGKVFWGLVEVAVPGSILRLLFIHWLKLLYLFEALLLLGGTVLVRPTIQQFGLVTLALTVAADFGASLLHDAMLGRHSKIKLVKALGFVIGILLGLLGLLTLFGLLGIKPVWEGIARVHEWLVQPTRWHRWSPAVLALALLAWIMRDDLRRLWWKYTQWLDNFRGDKNS